MEPTIFYPSGSEEATFDFNNGGADITTSSTASAASAGESTPLGSVLKLSKSTTTTSTSYDYFVDFSAWTLGTNDIPHTISGTDLTINQAGVFAVTLFYRIVNSTSDIHRSHILVNDVSYLQRIHRSPGDDWITVAGVLKLAAGDVLKLQMGVVTNTSINYDNMRFDISRISGFEYNEWVAGSRSAATSTHTLGIPSYFNENFNESSISYNATDINLSAGVYLVWLDLRTYTTTTSNFNYTFRLDKDGSATPYLLWENQVSYTNYNFFSNVYNMVLQESGAYTMTIGFSTSSIEAGTRIVILKKI